MTISGHIRIEKIIAGGKGLGRLPDGMVVMVDGVLPGEIAVILESKKSSGYLEAQLDAIEEPSSERTEPLCSHYGACGGCNLQHGAYPAQLRIKQSILRETLARAGVDCDDGILQSILPAPHAFGYRHRIRLKIDKQGEIGFHRTRSNTVIPISRCPVAVEPINTALASWRQAGSLTRLARYCSELELLYSPARDRVLTLLHAHKHMRRPPGELARVVGPVNPEEIAVKIRGKIEPLSKKAGELVLEQRFPANELHREFTLSRGPGCFSQVNAAQNEQLIRLVCTLIGDIKGKRVLDLYCGMGNFSIPLGLLGAGGLGVEQGARAIEWARRNAGRAGLDDWRFRVADVETTLDRLRQGKEERFACVVCDPPRRGIGKSITALAAAAPESIIYISCDPATLARDLKLIAGSGYQPFSITPVDMFPQTHHIESATLLKRN